MLVELMGWVEEAGGLDPVGMGAGVAAAWDGSELGGGSGILLSDCWVIGTVSEKLYKGSNFQSTCLVIIIILYFNNTHNSCYGIPWRFCNTFVCSHITIFIISKLNVQTNKVLYEVGHSINSIGINFHIIQELIEYVYIDILIM